MRILKIYAFEIIFGVILFFIPFILPIFKFIDDVNSTVSAVVSLYAIVAGFFIADAMSNYLRLQTLIAEENASLIALAEHSSRINNVNFVPIYDAIDEYMIAQLELDTLNHVMDTEKQIQKITSAVSNLKVNKEDGDSIDELLDIKEKVQEYRQEISLVAKKNLTFWHWTILNSLAFLVIVTILNMRNDSYSLNVFIGIMIVIVYSVLVLLREMDNNHLLEMKLSYENPREVFHTLGRPPYYPIFSLANVRKPDQNGEYRLGKRLVNGEFEYELIITK